MSDSESKGDNDMEEENVAQDDDQEMPEENEDDGLGQEEILQKTQKTLFIEQNEKDKSVGNFIFIDEDHTLGNSLRYLLAQRKDVDFVGYSIPHPLENKMNLRIQTYDKNSKDTLKLGLTSLCNLSDILQQKFISALNDFDQTDLNQNQAEQQQMVEESEEQQQQQKQKKKGGKKKK